MRKYIVEFPDATYEVEADYAHGGEQCVAFFRDEHGATPFAWTFMPSLVVDSEFAIDASKVEPEDDRG